MVRCLLFIIFIVLLVEQSQASLLFTTDMDLRYHNTDFTEHKAELHTIGVSFRKIFADEMGDRIILFLLAETMHNFKENMIDQGYLQYKGPLGKWNITLGRYRLPFGLLANYSTDRLLIKTIEYETIGFCSDNGLQISGILKDFDYAISLSQGVGKHFKSIDIDNQGLITFRVGYQGVDFEDFRIGLSGLTGKIYQEVDDKVGILNKKLLAIDIIKYSGRLVARSEFSYGKESEKTILGVFSGVDYAILPKIDINTGYVLVRLNGDIEQHSLSLGLTYNIFPNLQVRIAGKIPIKNEGGKNELSLQTYYVFARSF